MAAPSPSEKLERALSTAQLAKIDLIFAGLASADVDLFAKLDWLGNALAEEADAIVDLALQEQDAAVRSRIRDGRKRLTPLQDRVRCARSTLQAAQQQLGYTDAATSRRRTSNMPNITNITNISGSTFNAPSVFAGRIESSIIALNNASATPELKNTLDDLHKAVGQLTLSLPPDEQEFAVANLEELTSEATRATSVS